MPSSTHPAAQFPFLEAKSMIDFLCALSEIFNACTNTSSLSFISMGFSLILFLFLFHLLTFLIPLSLAKFSAVFILPFPPSDLRLRIKNEVWTVVCFSSTPSLSSASPDSRPPAAARPLPWSLMCVLPSQRQFLHCVFKIFWLEFSPTPWKHFLMCLLCLLGFSFLLFSCQISV